MGRKSQSIGDLHRIKTQPRFTRIWAFSTLNSNITEEGNGYLKFPDGTLIQWGRANFPSSGAGGAGYAVANFAIPFAGRPRVTATAEYTSGIQTFVVSAQPSTSSLTLYARTNAGGMVTGAYAYWTAIGTWKQLHRRGLDIDGISCERFWGIWCCCGEVERHPVVRYMHIGCLGRDVAGPHRRNHRRVARYNIQDDVAMRTLTGSDIKPVGLTLDQE